MKLKLLWKLVRQNMKSLREILVPFILAVSLMFALEYVMLSLVQNDYIQKRNENLPMILNYANILTAILTIVFIIYANNFVMKRRKQEFALKMVLGMEKKHLTWMLGLEAVIQLCIISLLSITGGYLFGNLVFMMLNRLVRSKGVTLMDYPFDIRSVGIVLLLIFVMMMVLFIINLLILSRQSPVKLLQGRKAGEKKTRPLVTILFLLIGLSALGYGYYLAQTTEGVISSLQTIFKAVLFVIIGTYLLFMSLTVLILQSLKSIGNIYYRPTNFLSISGLLARMRGNAVSLASITILCTFLMVTISMSLCTYQGIESQINGGMSQDYETSIAAYKKDGTVPKKAEQLMMDIDKRAKVDKYRTRITTMFPVYKTGKTFNSYMNSNNQHDSSKLIYVVVTTLDDHNLYNDEHVRLKNNEIAVSSNAERLNNFKDIKFSGENKKIVKLKKDYIGSKVAADTMYIVVKDINTFNSLLKYYNLYDGMSKKVVKPSVSTDIAFNVLKNKKQFNHDIVKIQKKYDIQIMRKDELSKMLYELNGGLIFIGIVVSFVMLIGMFLILYYKQISEGYEDKNNYKIMKKVGLPQKLIKTTIRIQILTVFILPIIIAALHTLMASKIIYQLLGILGFRNWSLFLLSYFGVLLAIMLVYGLMYLVTSRTYYHIINEE